MVYPVYDRVDCTQYRQNSTVVKKAYKYTKKKGLSNYKKMKDNIIVSESKQKNSAKKLS